MVSPAVEILPLFTGMRLAACEFLARWEALPDLKNAELIEGIVYLSSTVGFTHGRIDTSVIVWLGQYADETTGCESANNATCKLLGNLPQPDAFLCVKEEFGGSSRVQKDFIEGAPELAVEICTTSAGIDFGPKLALYKRAGVRDVRIRSRINGEPVDPLVPIRIPGEHRTQGRVRQRRATRDRRRNDQSDRPRHDDPPSPHVLVSANATVFPSASPHFSQPEPELAEASREVGSPRTSPGP